MDDASDPRPAAADGLPRAYGTAAKLLFVAIVLVGLAARTKSYVGDRSFFTDEASLALKVCDQSYGELPRPYGDGGIVAPLGLLAAMKACVGQLGYSNLAFRLLPFLAGLAALPIFAAACRVGLCGQAALPALALMAVTPSLVYHGAEAKQYSTDACCAAIVLLAVAAVHARPGSAGRLAALAVAGLAVPWFSHPSIFVLAAAGMATIAADLCRRATRAPGGPRRGLPAGGGELRPLVSSQQEHDRPGVSVRRLLEIRLPERPAPVHGGPE